MPVFSDLFPGDERSLQRLGEHESHGPIGLEQHRIGGVDIDSPRHGFLLWLVPRASCCGDQLVEQLADAPNPRGRGASLEPDEIFGRQGDGNSFPSHTINIAYQDWTVKVGCTVCCSSHDFSLPKVSALLADNSDLDALDIS